MHDQGAVSGRHSLAGFVENAQYFSKRGLAGTTPDIKGLAINPVHDQKGPAVLADAAVKKARNARMAELRQRLAFVLQKAGQVVALAADQLEGRLHLDRKSTRLNSSHVAISYAVFCLKKKTNNQR